MVGKLENIRVQGKYTYTIGKELGRGSFGAAHLATKPNGEQVVMKVSLLSSPLHVFQFAREAYIAKDLQHEHIVPVDDLSYFDHNGMTHFFFTMPVANKGSLRRYLTKNVPLAPEAAIPLVTQTSEGLYHGHTKQIIHRDVKPDNILLDERDHPTKQGEKYLHVMVGDFGIAMFDPMESMITKHEGGTLPYMSPEQFDGKPTMQSDQYGLAVVTHESLTGRKPFMVQNGLSGFQQLIQFKQLHQDGILPHFDEQLIRNHPVLRELEKIVRKGLSKNPGERFPSTREFGLSLRKVLIEYLQSGDANAPIRSIFNASSPQQPTDTQVNIVTESTLVDNIVTKQKSVQLENLADRLLYEKKYEEAEQLMRQALLLDPSRLKFIDKAKQIAHLSQLTKYLEHTKNKGSATMQLNSLEQIGGILMQLKMYLDAIEVFQEYIQIEGKTSENNLGGHFGGRNEIYKVLTQMGQAYEKIFQNKSALDAYNQALTIWEQRYIRTSGKRLRQPERFGPGDIFKEHILFYKAQVLDKLYRYDEALQVYAEARIGSAISPIEIYVQEGLVLRKLNRMDEALDAFQKAYQENSDDVKKSDISVYIAGTLYVLQRLEEALQYYDIAIQLNPKNSTALMDKGWRLKDVNRYEEAILAYQQAFLLNPTEHGIYLSGEIANLYVTVGKFSEALQAFNTAIYYDKKHLLPKAVLLEQLGRYPEALEAYDMYIQEKKPKGEFGIFYAKAVILHRLHRYDEASSTYDDALQALAQKKLSIREPLRNNIKYGFYDERGKILCGKAAALEQLGRAEEALQVYESAFQNGIFYEALNLKGNLLQRLRRYNDALETYRIALQSPFSSEKEASRIYLKIGYVLNKLQQYTDALDAFDKVITYDPKNSEAWKGKAETLKQLGRIIEAEEALKHTLKY